MIYKVTVTVGGQSQTFQIEAEPESPVILLKRKALDMWQGKFPLNKYISFEIKPVSDETKKGE